MTEWTPSAIGKGTTWTARSALNVARRLSPASGDQAFTRTSLKNATKRVLNKEAVVTLFKEKKVPLNFDEFLASRADFDLDSTDGMCNCMMGRARVCTHVNHVVSSQWPLCMHAQPTSRRPLDARTGEHIVTTWRSTFLNYHRRFNVR